MILALHIVAVAAYLAATGLLVRALLRGGTGGFAAITATAALGVLAHLGGVLAFAVVWGELPLQGIGPVVTSIGLLIGVGALMLTLLERAGPMALVLVPVAALCAGVAILVGLTPGASEVAYAGAWFVLHVSLAAVAYACLAVAFAAGLMYLLQFRELKDKRFGRVFRFFPPLDTLDRAGGVAIALGLTALTVALVLGALHAAIVEPGWTLRDPHLVWGVMTWLVFGAVLAVRAAPRRSGFRAAAASVAGFVVVVLAYLVLRTQVSPGGVFL